MPEGLFHNMEWPLGSRALETSLLPLGRHGGACKLRMESHDLQGLNTEDSSTLIAAVKSANLARISLKRVSLCIASVKPLGSVCVSAQAQPSFFVRFVVNCLLFHAFYHTTNRGRWELVCDFKSW